MFEVHNNGRNTHRNLSTRGFYGFKNVCSIHSSVKYSTNACLHTCYLVGYLTYAPPYVLLMTLCFK